MTRPGGGLRRLRAFIRCYRTATGERRFMAVVEDRSVEEERDLAQMQIGALMDTAGVGIATFEESSGWVRQRSGSGSASVVPQNISREIVVPESRPNTSGCNGPSRAPSARRCATRSTTRSSASAG